MYRIWALAALACLAVALAVPRGSANVSAANPEDGMVMSGKYTNEYFRDGLSIAIRLGRGP
jgi:hypothetical protein